MGSILPGISIQAFFKRDGAIILIRLDTAAIKVIGVLSITFSFAKISITTSPVTELVEERHSHTHKSLIYLNLPFTFYFTVNLVANSIILLIFILSITYR